MSNEYYGDFSIHENKGVIIVLNGAWSNASK
jgi:hypothetical protein